MDGKIEQDRKSPIFPIVLRGSPAALTMELLFCVFFCLVTLLLGLAAGAWLMGGLAVLAMSVCGAVVYCQSRQAVIFERDQVTVQTAFSQASYPYEGTDALIRRSTTMIWRSRGGSLAGIALALRVKGQIVVSVPVHWGVPPEALQQAVAWVEQLPIPRRYI